jgi:hypothetical protein
MAGGSIGVPLWCLISVIGVPLLSRQMPDWSAEQMRQHFPALVGWVVYGALLGIISQALQDGAEYFFGPEPAPKAPAVSVNKRIVILGGGFAGMRLLALELDREDTVSLGRAAELCQTPLAAFMDFAVKHRVPHSGTALRTSNKNPRLLTVSNPGRRNWSPLSC